MVEKGQSSSKYTAVLCGNVYHTQYSINYMYVVAVVVVVVVFFKYISYSVSWLYLDMHTV